MKYFSTIINEDIWNVYLTDDEDHVISEEGSAADTSVMNKEMFFRRSEINLINILHEIWHAQFRYTYISDTTEMTLGDIEEVSAALFADRGERMLIKGNEVYNKLIELRDEP